MSVLLLCDLINVFKTYKNENAGDETKWMFYPGKKCGADRSGIRFIPWAALYESYSYYHKQVYYEHLENLC